MNSLLLKKNPLMNKLIRDQLDENPMFDTILNESNSNLKEKSLMRQSLVNKLTDQFQNCKIRIATDIFVMPLQNLTETESKFYENINYKIVLQWVNNREPKKQVEIHIIEDTSNSHKKQQSKESDDLLKGNVSIFKKDIITQLHSVMYSDVQLNKDRQNQKNSTRNTQIKLYQELFGPKQSEDIGALLLLSDKQSFKKGKPKYKEMKSYEVMENLFNKFNVSSVVRSGYQSIVNPYDPHDSQGTFALEIKDQLIGYRGIRDLIYQASIEKNKSLIFQRQEEYYQVYPPNCFHLLQLIVNLKTQLLNQDVKKIHFYDFFCKRALEYRVNNFIYLQRILAFFIMVENLKFIKKYSAKYNAIR